MCKGYQLNVARHRLLFVWLSYIHDLCVSAETDCSPSKTCDYDCNVVDGVDTCTCGKGYQLNANGYSCDGRLNSFFS